MSKLEGIQPERPKEFRPISKKEAKIKPFANAKKITNTANKKIIHTINLKNPMVKSTRSFQKEESKESLNVNKFLGTVNL